MRMNSSGALLRACGLTFHRMPEDRSGTMTHMKNMTARIAVIGFAGVLSFVGVLSAAPATQGSPASGEAQLATIKQYCVGCHNDKAKLGGISFENISAATVAGDPERFEKAVRKLRGRVMPP